MMLMFFTLTTLLFLLVPVRWNDPWYGRAEEGMGLDPADQVADAAPRVTVPEKCAFSSGEDAPYLIDVRSPAAYAEGHIPGAVRLPPRLVLSRKDAIPESRAIVLYDNWPREYYAVRQRNFMLGGGFAGRDIKVLEGGIRGWKAAGCELKTGNKP